VDTPGAHPRARPAAVGAASPRSDDDARRPSSTALSAGAPGVAGQPLTERTPNLSGPWVSSPWNLHFQLAHRFRVAGDNRDITDIFGDAQIVNYPTFDVSLGLPAHLMTGVRYSSRSFVASGQPNEWQPYLKWAPFRSRGSDRTSVALTGAWNATNESFDAEASAQSYLGPLFFIGAIRGFSNLYGDLADPGQGEAIGVAGGVGVKINRYVTLAGDVADVVSGGELDGESPTPGWSAGLHIGIPYTPHTFSIMATNVTSGTLQGTSGVIAGFPNEVYWGFELTVPFSGFARWGRILDPEPGTREENRAALARGEAVVEIEISGLSFGRERLEIPAGTTVRWVNRDPVAHTATAEDESWTSPSIGPGETFEHTFTTVGEFSYHCIPHPFMKSVIAVTER